MKNQALFSLKDKSKKLKFCPLQFVFGALMVKDFKLLPNRKDTAFVHGRFSSSITYNVK